MVTPENLRPDHTLLVSVSGGKDSTAMALWLRFESGLQNDMRFVHAETGHEHPDTEAHVEILAKKLDAPIEKVAGPYTFLSLAEHKMSFPSGRRRFCTEELKVKPMAELVNSLLDEGVDPVMAVGIRAEESKKRAAMSVWDERIKAYDAPVWRPLLEWSSAEVFECHARNNMPVNPLYLKGAFRVGCWPCVMARKADIGAAFIADPDLLDRLREYERIVGEKSRFGIATLFAYDKVPPRYRDKSYVNDQGVEVQLASIDAVYAWAMDGQPDPSDSEEPAACFSQYGLCE